MTLKRFPVSDNSEVENDEESLDDRINEIKNLLKRAVRFALHANRICNDPTGNK